MASTPKVEDLKAGLKVRADMRSKGHCLSLDDGCGDPDTYCDCLCEPCLKAEGRA